jgi:hypothetical protein
VDRWRFTTTPLSDDVVRLVSESDDMTLIVEAPGTRIPIVAEDAADGMDAVVYLGRYPTEEIIADVTGRDADATGTYRLRVECPSVSPTDAGLPRESAGQHEIVFPWSGIYRRLDDNLRFVPGLGLAVDIQRGNFFGVLYEYDDMGNPRFRTLQGAEQADSPRTYSGSIFLTREATITEQVGSFDAVLGSRNFATIELTIGFPGEPADTGEWFSFIFGNYGRLFMEGATIELQVETDDPDEQALLRRFGGRVTFANRANTFTTSVDAATPDGRFRGFIAYSSSPDIGVGLSLSDREVEGDGLGVELVLSPHGFAGTAVISIDGQRGLIRNATGLIVTSERDLRPR